MLYFLMVITKLNVQHKKHIIKLRKIQVKLITNKRNLLRYLNLRKNLEKKKEEEVGTNLNQELVK